MKCFVDFCLTGTNDFCECREFKSTMKKNHGMIGQLEHKKYMMYFLLVSIHEFISDMRGYKNSMTEFL